MRAAGRLAPVIAAVLALLLVAGHALAAPGDLDTTFDGDGRLTSTFGANTEAAWDVAL